MSPQEQLELIADIRREVDNLLPALNDTEQRAVLAIWDSADEIEVQILEEMYAAPVRE